MVTKFGKFLRILRLKNNEIIADMSSKLGISISYLSAIENGKRDIPDNFSDKIINLYSLSGEDISELNEAIDLSLKEAKISLDGLSSKQRELGLLCARKIKELSDEDIKKIKDLLK